MSKPVDAYDFASWNSFEPQVGEFEQTIFTARGQVGDTESIDYREFSLFIDNRNNGRCRFSRIIKNSDLFRNPQLFDPAVAGVDVLEIVSAVDGSPAPRQVRCDIRLAFNDKVDRDTRMLIATEGAASNVLVHRPSEDGNLGNLLKLVSLRKVNTLPELGGTLLLPRQEESTDPHFSTLGVSTVVLFEPNSLGISTLRLSSVESDDEEAVDENGFRLPTSLYIALVAGKDSPANEGDVDRSSAPTSYGIDAAHRLNEGEPRLYLGTRFPDNDEAIKLSSDDFYEHDASEDNGIRSIISAKQEDGRFSLSAYLDVVNDDIVPARVGLWLDTNGNGCFEPEEGRVKSVSEKHSGPFKFEYGDVETISADRVVARARLTTAEITAEDFNSLVVDGEVEDTSTRIFGDLPPQVDAAEKSEWCQDPFAAVEAEDDAPEEDALIEAISELDVPQEIDSAEEAVSELDAPQEIEEEASEEEASEEEASEEASEEEASEEEASEEEASEEEAS
ncbi:hypothetical protein OAS86_03190, partial [Gammaproteobacteria bacterium]|nr:hypothetical protein [Gammaproteobacteria bacterium]